MPHVAHWPTPDGDVEPGVGRPPEASCKLPISETSSIWCTPRVSATASCEELSELTQTARTNSPLRRSNVMGGDRCTGVCPPPVSPGERAGGSGARGVSSVASGQSWWRGASCRLRENGPAGRPAGADTGGGGRLTVPRGPLLWPGAAGGASRPWDGGGGGPSRKLVHSESKQERSSWSVGWPEIPAASAAGCSTGGAGRGYRRGGRLRGRRGGARPPAQLAAPAGSAVSRRVGGRPPDSASARATRRPRRPPQPP
eukprot:scaffold28964_cov79-Isochrysis_galbana.AAC.1